MEICLRSLLRSIVNKELTSSRGLNVQEECQKIRGASTLGTDVCGSLFLIICLMLLSLSSPWNEMPALYGACHGPITEG